MHRIAKVLSGLARVSVALARFVSLQLQLSAWTQPYLSRACEFKALHHTSL